jgi:alkanesulfonate monooxygenase
VPIEFIGMVEYAQLTETRGAEGGPPDLQYVRRCARAHEDSEFDRILIAHTSTHPDALQMTAYAASHTERLNFLVAHRPGFASPTVAARSFATLDHITGGRVAMHTISGGSDADQQRDGDYLGKEDRYARSGEYLEILTRAWTETEPFSHEGRFYRFKDYVPSLHPYQQPRIPLYFGGSSPSAYAVGAKHADVYALFGEPLAAIAEQIDSVRAAAEAAGRDEPPRISVSFRPILGATEELAWERAERILETTVARMEAGEGIAASRVWRHSIGSVSTERQVAAAMAGDRHDRCLWTGIARVTGALGNSTALVGTPETVAEALMDYVELGATTLLIRGFDPYDDAVDYGRELIPRVRAEVARREAEGSLVSASA